MDNKQPILSICIPTYNRAKFLQTSLDRLKENITADMDVEVLVSDNCSPDNTSKVVMSAIDNGLKCTYIRNEKNLGPDGNFMQCFQKAQGKYLWLCGDDDYLIPGQFKRLYDILASGDYGLVELNMRKPKFGLAPKVFTDTGEFLTEVSEYITFMSSNIMRKEIVDQVDGEKYKGTYLIQTPYYLTSATIGLPNLVYYPQVLEWGADDANSGGYNLFQVFCDNLLTIIHEIVESGKLSEKQFQSIKKAIYCNWLVGYYARFFINHDYGNFNMDNAKEYLHKWYGRESYYYYVTGKQWIKYFINKIIRRA